jgi:GxxExxY protein
LIQKELNIKAQYPLPLVYKDVRLDCGYRLDIIVEDKIVVEVKSVEALNDIHMAQMLTYLKLTGCKLGYLLNFNVVLFKTGIKRVVNNL